MNHIKTRKITHQKYKWAITSIFVALASLQGCASQPSQLSVTGETDKIIFPNIEKSAWVKEGTFPNINNLRNVAPGMNKTNIYALLGRPHFNEGMWSVREWDYIFNFHKANDTAVEVCQYKVIYTANLLLQSTYWMPESCADWLKLPVPVVIERIVEKPVQVIVEKIIAGPTRVQLSGDGIFEFNKSGIADLRPGGLEKLNRVATELLSSGEIGEINIIGHTDRLGSDAYNLALSLARATTIRQQFISKGIAAGHIAVSGAGKSAPLVECRQNKRDEALIRCLEPNRRFEIEAWGVLKP